MGWTSLADTLFGTGKRGDSTLFQNLNGNVNYLYGQLGGNAGIDVYNGSFEVDSDADDIPDGWTRSLYAGGSSIYGNGLHGAKSFQFVHPGGGGNGGGYLTSDYIPCTEHLSYILRFVLDVSTGDAGIHVLAEVDYYDKDQVILGASPTDTIYDSTSNPETAEIIMAGFKPNTGARWMKIRLIGGKDDVDDAGTVVFDGVSLLPFSPMSFDGNWSFAARAHTNSSWANVGSAITMNLPWRIHNIPTMLTFAIEIKGVIGSSYARFVVGSDNSTVGVVSSDLGYFSVPINLQTTPAGNTISIQPQGYDNGSGGSDISKLATNCLVTLLQPT